MSQCAILVTDQRLLPPWGGNRVRILGLINSLRKLGWRVVLVTVRYEGSDLLAAVVDELVYADGMMFAGGDIRNFDATPFRLAVAKVAKRLRPAMAIAEYAWLGPALLALPRSVLRCIDCHDLLFERTTRFQATGLDPWITSTQEDECALLNCADMIIAIQLREAAILRRLLPTKNVQCLMPYIDLPGSFARKSHNGAIVLAVGGKHAGNEGICDFATLAWPRILSRVSEARLHIVGGICERVPSLPGVELFGETSDLCVHYDSAAVVVCPIDVGTGAKIKMLEALRYGKAIVATTMGVEGLPPAVEPAWVTAHKSSLCDAAVLKLLLNRDLRSQLENSAFVYGQKFLSPEAFLKQLRSILPNILMQFLARIAI